MLALGIGGTATIFNFYNAMFLRPFPLPEPSRLVDLDETAPKWNLEYVGISDADYHAWRKNSSFEAIGCYKDESFNLVFNGSVRRVRGAKTTADLIHALRLKPILGRAFLPEEDRPGGPKAVVLGHELWQTQFHGRSDVLGKALRLNSEAYTIVGVLPPEAVFPDADLWVPLAPPESGTYGWYLSGVGRLKPGVSIAQARADLIRLHRAQVPLGRTANAVTSPRLTPLAERFFGRFQIGMSVLLGAMAIVFLIACANTAGLMTVRAAARAREVAIRSALGASYGNIVRQLLTESALLAAVGGVCGILLSSFARDALLPLMPSDMPRWLRFDFDYRFAVFCIALTGAAAMLFGLIPALHAPRTDVVSSLRQASARLSLSRKGRRFLSGLVIGEVALALLLLIGASLLVQAFRRVLDVPSGFRPDGVLAFSLALPNAKYGTPAQQSAFYDRLLARLAALPGVEAAGAASVAPLGGHEGAFFYIEGAPPPAPDEPNPVVLRAAVNPGYFDALGISFRSGRKFNESDGRTGRAAIVDESFAKRFFPNVNPLGRHIRYVWAPDEWMEVVAVTRDVKHYGLDENARPGVYIPYAQEPQPGMTVLLRTGSRDPSSVIASARGALRQLDRELPMYNISTMRDSLSRALWPRRLYSWVAVAFASVSLLMAIGGIYGVVSYAVGQRTHEIGLRMALGASNFRVLLGVLGQGLILAALGGALGIAGAIAASKLMTRVLFGISATDAMTYAVAAAAFDAIVLLATWIPARRAARVDPMQALRFE